MPFAALDVDRDLFAARAVEDQVQFFRCEGTHRRVKIDMVVMRDGFNRLPVIPSLLPRAIPL